MTPCIKSALAWANGLPIVSISDMYGEVFWGRGRVDEIPEQEEYGTPQILNSVSSLLAK